MGVVVIGGHQRSGTTMLRGMCNRHPQITMTLEFANFRGLGRRYFGYRRLLKHRWRTIQRKVPQEWQQDAFSEAYLQELGPYRGRRIDAAVIGQVLQRLFPDAKVVGDKYPDYVFMLDDLAQDDTLKRVIIYRDCRDVTSSVLVKVRTDWKHHGFIKKLDTPEKIARRWITAIELMETHRDRVFAIRYEDFVESPRQIAQGLGEYLGVEPSGFPTQHLRTDSVGKYRQGLSRHELDAVLAVAGPVLERLGYT
jgi:hypothetical protein